MASAATRAQSRGARAGGHQWPSGAPPGLSTGAPGLSARSQFPTQAGAHLQTCNATSMYERISHRFVDFVI